MASGAHAILIPEVSTTMEEIYQWVREAHERGRAPLVVVSEGFVPEGFDEAFSVRGVDSFGRARLGGIGEMLAPLIEEQTGLETRATVLGHIQRGGVPTAFDRVLATRLGMAAVDSVADSAWSTMVAIHGTKVNRVPLRAALNNLKRVPADRYEEARVLFG
jgi:6-phosphofructokinase 1